MRPWLSLLLLGIPALPLLAGLVTRFGPAQQAGRTATIAAAFAALLAAVVTIAAFAGGQLVLPFGSFGITAAVGLKFRVDAIAGIMVVLVSFLGFVVLRFSRHYLDGDPGQSRFFSWMSLTLASVLTLVLASNLLLLLLAWIATSLCLHRLLLHYPERAGAVFSARKKFVVSRLAELCLFVAAVLLFRAYGTWDLEGLFAAARARPDSSLPLVGGLLVTCAALKSAQFPFHGWLPDTMETPTPVSALMHAGIINAGGYLIVRLGPILAEAPGALHALAAVGAVTAAFGAVVMLAQPSVKRALAFSTIAQMGFMMVQCGLGASGLALLHIVAHSLYKAHAFLNAGSTVGAAQRAAIPLGTPALSLGVLVGGLIVAFVATALQALQPVAATPDGFTVVLALALAYGLARSWSTGAGWRTVVRSTGVAFAIGAAGVALQTAGRALVPDLPSAPPPAVLGFVALVFTSLFLFQALLWRAAHHALGRRWYVYALNGFYVGTLGNRLLGRLWPRPFPG